MERKMRIPAALAVVASMLTACATGPAPAPPPADGQPKQLVPTVAATLRPVSTALLPLIATDQRYFTGDVNIGGRFLKLICYGTGDPPIVLEMDMLGGSDRVFTNITPDLLKVSRTCSYFRPNTFESGGGLSNPDKKRRTSLDQVEDLRALLDKAGLKPPYVLVSNGYGALIDTLYASKYPKEVVGLVLIDPTPPGVFQTLLKMIPAVSAGESDQTRSLRTFWENYAQGVVNDQYDERFDIMLDLPASEKAALAVKTLGDLPITLMRNKDLRYDFGPSLDPAIRQKMITTTLEAQSFFTGLSSNVKVVDVGVEFYDYEKAAIEAVTQLAKRPR